MTATGIPLPFTIHFGEPRDTIGKAVCEFMTNAMDASLGLVGRDKSPTLGRAGTHLYVEDFGRGLTQDHFSVLGRSAARDPTKHGSHGSGMKEAVAFCVREGLGLEIKTVGWTFTFEKVQESKIVLNFVRNTRVIGTKITVDCRDAKKAERGEGNVRQQFLHLLKPKKIGEVDDIHMYEGSGVFLMGVKREGHPPVSRIYDFVTPTEPQKNSITRNHTFLKKSFKKFFQERIENANQFESFGVNAISAGDVVPRVAPANSNVSIKQELICVNAISAGDVAPHAAPANSNVSVKRELICSIADNCLTQDYHMWTATSEERAHLQDTKSRMVQNLKMIEGVSVNATYDAGSLAKNTFVPLSSDVDIVVEVVRFADDTEHTRSELIKSKLREQFGARLEDSGHNIINCTFEDVQFDLVLIDSDNCNERSKRIRESILLADMIIGREDNDRQKRQSFMRAVKYWSKRNGLKIRSFCLEAAVLSMWVSLTKVTSGRICLSTFFMRIGDVLTELSGAFDLLPGDISDVEAAAHVSLQLLRT